MNEWMKQIGCIYSMKCYSAMKKNEEFCHLQWCGWNWGYCVEWNKLVKESKYCILGTLSFCCRSPVPASQQPPAWERRERERRPPALGGGEATLLPYKDRTLVPRQRVILPPGDSPARDKAQWGPTGPSNCRCRCFQSPSSVIWIHLTCSGLGQVNPNIRFVMHLFYITSTNLFILVDWGERERDWEREKGELLNAWESGT